MKYISEERLKEILASFNNNFGDVVEAKRCLLDYLLEFECTELNQWQTIESAPKDREILVYAPAYQDLRFLISVCKWHESAGFCIDELRQPTHWMELPKPPRED